jgi:hypothetical protein
MEKYYARKLILKKISQQEAFNFLSQHHEQKAANSKHNYGFYTKEGNLIGVGCFGRPRFNKLYSWELIRWCLPKDVYILGGLSKLCKNFSNEYGGDIISYCHVDQRSNGEGYKKAGWILLKKVTSLYHYENEKGEKFSRFQFQIKNLYKHPRYEEAVEKGFHFNCVDGIEKFFINCLGDLYKVEEEDKYLFYWPPNHIPTSYVYKITDLHNRIGATYVGSLKRIEIWDKYWGNSTAFTPDPKIDKKEILHKCTSYLKCLNLEIEEINKQTGYTYNLYNINIVEAKTNHLEFDEEAYKKIEEAYKKAHEEKSLQHKKYWSKQSLEKIEKHREKISKKWGQKTEEEKQIIVEKRLETINWDVVKENRKKTWGNKSEEEKQEWRKHIKEGLEKTDKSWVEKRKETVQNLDKTQWSNNIKEAHKRKTDEEKQQWIEHIQQGWNKTEEEKEIIKEKIKNNWANKSIEEKENHRKKLQDIYKNKTEEEKQEHQRKRLESFNNRPPKIKIIFPDNHEQNFVSDMAAAKYLASILNCNYQGKIYNHVKAKKDYLGHKFIEL